ncbi:T9SS type A sorting domain-containing protein [Formosa sp. 3Alg 14/1]|uniref:T9SS type A sorting domain-containing protein n=1 Tax=Formosa sp. 3Alg 14/1 TaxID=3382190 RepID=UPI0039BE2666
MIVKIVAKILLAVLCFVPFQTFSQNFDLDTSTEVYPTLPKLNKPDYLKSVVDPVFKTKITRITGDVGTKISNTNENWRNIARHGYSVRQPWNADESILYLSKHKSSSGGWGSSLFLDGQTYEVLGEANVPSSKEVRWHPTDPDLMFLLQNNGIQTWNYKTNQIKTLISYSGYTKSTIGGYTGNFTDDGSKVAVLATRSSDNKEVGFVLDLKRGIKHNDIDLSSLKVDYIMVSSLGNYMVVNGDFGQGNDRTKIFDLDGNQVGAFWSEYGRPSHGDVAVDENGDEVLVGVSKSKPDGGRVIKRRLKDGKVTVLTSGSYAGHVSARALKRKGWVFADTSESTNWKPYLGELLAVKLDGTRVERICNLRKGLVTYDNESQPCPSPSGSRVIFASDWDSGGYPIQAYVVDYRNGQVPDESIDVNAGDDQTICEDEDVVLKASGASAYKWSTGETTASITVSPDKTTTYTVTGTDSSGQTDTDEVKITVQDALTVDAGENVTICVGESVTLKATGSGDFEWSTGEKTNTITVSPSKTATYTVTTTNGMCSNSDEVTVTVSPRQTINAGSDVNIDKGESTKLSVTGKGSFLWSTGETTSTITVSPDETTVYTVTVSLNGCESQDDVKVTVNMPQIEVIANAGDNQIICEGETVTLTATGGSSYLWSTGETTARITVNPNATTTYSVDVSEEGVTASDEVTVTVNPLPIANAGSDTTIEQGESITLSASGGTRYKWSTGAITRDISVSPNQTTIYSVEVFTDGDCSASDDVKVTVNMPQIEVIANAGYDQTICEGESVTLTATGGSSYVWSTGETTAHITVNPNETTTYTVDVSEEGVTASDEVTVVVNPLPTANAGPDQAIEQRESITLSASGGTRYKWNTGATTKDITVSPNQTTTYSVEVFTDGDCSASDDVKVTVNSPQIEVIANAGDNQIICEGESVTLTATGGSSYIWSTGETTARITVNPNATTTYSVDVSEEGVTASDEVTVIVNPLPIANAGSDKTIEQGESITLSASGGTRYKWNTGATTKDISVSPNQTTIYSVEVFTDGDCSASDEVKVTVNMPQIEVIANAGDNQIICEGETVTLTATGGSSYLWSTGETTANITVNPNATTTYAVDVSEEGVTASDEVTVIVNPLPIANAGSDQTIEQGESITLSASGGTRYKWNTGATTKDITVSPNQTTIYSVGVFTDGDCSARDEVKVTVNSPQIEVIANAGDDQTICEGESVTLTATGGTSFLWSTGETTARIIVNPSSTTTYTVDVSEEGITASNEVTVIVNPLPTAHAGLDKTIEQGESITLSASGGTRYKWNTGATTKDITVSPNQTTIYSVEVFNDDDCSASDDVKVTVNMPQIEVIANAGDDQTICEGASVTLTAIGGSSYVWSTGETTARITVNPSSTTTYIVDVSEEGVTASDEVTVTVNPLPTANAGSDTTIEQGESITLSASGGTRYMWNTGATSKDILVSPNQTTIYSVEVFTDGDCSASDEVKVTVNMPQIEVIANAGDDQTICEGESVTLTATGGSRYLWSTGETTARIIVNPSSTTTYIVDVSEEGVTASDEVTVTVNPLPIANAGSDKTIEQGESITLSASGGTRYKWNTGATTKDISVSPNQTTIYSVEVFTDGDCSASDDVKVNVNMPQIEVIANAGDNQTICEGESVTLTATGGASYVWSTGETTARITVNPSATTTYSVAVSEEGVTASDEVTVTVNPLPTANAGEEKRIDQGESVRLTAAKGAGYLWNTGETTQSITVHPDTTTIYSVEVFNGGGCSAEDEVLVIVEAHILDIEEETLNFEFNIYPNPATDVLNVKIEGLEADTPIRIFDMSGKLLYNQVIQAGGRILYKTLDVSRYPKGMYILTIERRGLRLTKKLVLR